MLLKSKTLSPSKNIQLLKWAQLVYLCKNYITATEDKGIYKMQNKMTATNIICSPKMVQDA